MRTHFEIYLRHFACSNILSDGKLKIITNECTECSDNKRTNILIFNGIMNFLLFIIERWTSTHTCEQVNWLNGCRDVELCLVHEKQISEALLAEAPTLTQSTCIAIQNNCLKGTNRSRKCAANILKSNLFIMYDALMFCFDFCRCFMWKKFKYSILPNSNLWGIFIFYSLLERWFRKFNY